MKTALKLRLVECVVSGALGGQTPDDDAIEAIRELVGQAGTAIDDQLITNLQLNLNDTKTELTRVLDQLERVRGYAQNYLEDNGKLRTENDGLKARLKALEAAPATQSKPDPAAARIAGLEKAPAAKEAKAEGQKTNRPKTTRITKTTAVTAERWAALTQRAIDALKARGPIKLRTLTTEILGRIPAGRETHKLLAELQSRLGDRLVITGLGTTHDPTMLHLVEPHPEPEPPAQLQPPASDSTANPVESLARSIIRDNPDITVVELRAQLLEQGLERRDISMTDLKMNFIRWKREIHGAPASKLAVSPELAERLEHSNEPIVTGNGIPEEDYSPEVKAQIERMAALRPSAEERAKILSGGH